ncbi:hypothetical protein F5884DRAFT_862023 [Xylogone sp. PMI_703]|nr:hypothetical protein F5884DRAFT_862023 [Xylogone sp. PMI_703]
MATTNGRKESEEDCADPVPSRSYRVKFESGPGVAVYGCPSKGGMYFLSPCFGVELEFLKLDRFGNTEILQAGSSQVDEDDHCNRMCQLDATWWRSRRAFNSALFDGPRPAGPFLSVGWPAGGGVWVIKTTLEEADKKGTAKIYNAYSIEERCKMIEQLGGVFYADPKDCPHLDLSWQ